MFYLCRFKHKAKGPVPASPQGLAHKPDAPCRRPSGSRYTLRQQTKALSCPHDKLCSPSHENDVGSGICLCHRFSSPFVGAALGPSVVWLVLSSKQVRSDQLNCGDSSDVLSKRKKPGREELQISLRSLYHWVPPQIARFWQTDASRRSARFPAPAHR